MADKTVMDLFADMAKQVSLPKIDYEAFVDIHRKNIEAMQKSAGALSEGGRAVFAKQQEILAEVGREARQLIADFKPGGSPQGSCGQAGGIGQARPRSDGQEYQGHRRTGPEIRQRSAQDRSHRMRASFAEARAPAAKRPRSFSIVCARALPKPGRPSSSARLENSDWQ